MTITITDYELGLDTHDMYKVEMFDDSIRTLVTHTPSKVKSWIKKIERIHRYRLHKLIVGLDIEWRPKSSRGAPDNPVATLQLCVGHNCLIFQLILAPSIPRCLIDFLADQDYTFVGVGIKEDVEKLITDYGLEVANFLDLRDLEARRSGWSWRRQVGLKRMAEEILGYEFDKPQKVSRSNWDEPYLSLDQVKYACLDAFVSFEIGRVLQQQIIKGN